VDYYIDGVLRVSHPQSSPLVTRLMRFWVLSTQIARPFNADWVRWNQYPASGTFTGCPIDAGQSVPWSTFYWNGITPTGTGVSVETRTSLDGTNWSAWSAASSAGNFAITSPAGRYLQYRLSLSTTDAMRSPQINDITVSVSTTPGYQHAHFNFYPNCHADQYRRTIAHCNRHAAEYACSAYQHADEYRLFRLPSTPTNTPVPPTSTPTNTPIPTATNTPTPIPDLIFADGFETGTLIGWTASVTDSGDLSLSTAAALVGTRGLQALLDDNTSIYVTDDSPSAESRYRARFYFDPNTIP
ncbi:MAG: hypothetical protein HC875_32150, partial [Anaerolineales bacterium]|nr:hypothetical protein [Anaerolineales bacterium]